MRRCFQCGTRTDAARMTAVGDGEFCEACFRGLLAAASGPASIGGAPAPGSGSANARTRERQKRRSCLVCERDIAGHAAVSFLGGEICATCNEQMARELREAEPSAGATVNAAAGAKPLAGDSPPSDVAQSEVQAASFTPGGATRWCAGCERPMPGPGSYRIIDGEPYCAACVPFYASRDRGERRRRAASTASLPSTAGSPATLEGECDCCGATLAPGDEPHRGFALCQACLTSDPELALSVARARHRRKLDALRSQVDPEDEP